MDCRNIHAYVRHRYIEEGLTRRRPYLHQSDVRERSPYGDARTCSQTARFAPSQRTAHIGDAPSQCTADAKRKVARAKRRSPTRAHGVRTMATALVVIALALCAGAAVKAAASALAHMMGSAESGEVSTPVSQWERGNTPLLLQTDPSWANDPYAGATVGISGCGPTCMTAAYVCQTGRANFDPSRMAQFAQERGFVEDGLTTWAFMTEGAHDLGMSSEELPGSVQSVATALANGSSVIASVGPGDFTSQGHFIVITRYNEEGTFSVMDPNSAERSGQTWDAERVIAQCRNLWALHGR